KRIERGDLEAKERLINSNLRLVIKFARRYQGHGLALGDLVQEAMLGLIRAAEKFDWRRGYKFSTYAVLWIKPAIQRGLDNSGTPRGSSASPRSRLAGSRRAGSSAWRPTSRCRAGARPPSPVAGKTFVFFPEGAYGPTNNCVGIGDVLRRRGHRVVFIVEESFAGTL